MKTAYSAYAGEANRHRERDGVPEPKDEPRLADEHAERRVEGDRL